MSAHREARAPAVSGARAFARRVFTGDRAAQIIVGGAAASILVLTGALVYELWVNSSLAREKFGWGFLTSTAWNPVTEELGALTYIYGTVVTSVLALLIAVPIGLGAAIFLAELAPRRISNSLTFLIELLAAVPSVIYGLLGIFVIWPLLKDYVAPVLKATLGWTPLFSGPFYGMGFFTAGIVLAVMTVPFIVSVSRQVLLAVPPEQREGSLALGATKWETTWRVVVPFARNGITGSVFLALARALGETMAVTMVIGNTPQIKASLFAPGYTIASVLANEFSEASGVYRSALIECGLVLFALTIVINGLARLLVASTVGTRSV